MEPLLRHDKWKGTTEGTSFMQKALVFCMAWMPLPVAYSGMVLVIPFYMVFNHRGYISQYHFFRRRIGYGPFKSFLNVSMNHFTFGQIILDRFAVYGGSKFNIEVEGNPIFLDKINQEEGFLQLSSHVGNFELAGYLLKQDKKVINGLVFAGETKTIMQNRRRVFQAMNVRLIEVSADMSHVYTMNNSLEQGEIIAMPGDRNLGSSKTIKCHFMGAEAEFPMGPYILAANRDIKMLSIFVMKQSMYKYRIYVKEVLLPTGAEFETSRAKASALAQSFAYQLEDIVKMYPHQWFNYYEFWNE